MGTFDPVARPCARSWIAAGGRGRTANPGANRRDLHRGSPSRSAPAGAVAAAIIEAFVTMAAMAAAKGIRHRAPAGRV
jgi:hypothetical protein